MSIPAAKARSPQGWREGVEGAHDFMEKFQSGELEPLDIWKLPRMPSSKQEVEKFVNALMDNMDFDGLARMRLNQLWELHDVQVEVFAMGVELSRLLEDAIAQGRR